MDNIASELSGSSANCCCGSTQGLDPAQYNESDFSDALADKPISKLTPSSASVDAHVGHQNYQQADYTGMYEKLTDLHGYDIKADIRSLMEYTTSNFKPNSLESTAAFVVGMDKVSRHLYKKVLPEMVKMGGEAREHAFDLLQTSTHFNHKHGGEMNQATDKGDFSVKHIANYFKKYEPASKYLSQNDLKLSAEDRADISSRIVNNNEDFSDIFGQGGSSDGGSGESYHAIPIAAWVGSPHGKALEGASASIRYQGNNPANGNMSVDQVKKAPGNPTANSDGYAHIPSNFNPSRMTWEAGSR